MGLLSLLIAAIILALFLTYSHFAKPTQPFTPQDSKNIQTEAQSAVDATLQKSKLEQNAAKNLSQP